MYTKRTIIILTERAPIDIDYTNWKSISEAIFNQTLPPPYQAGIKVLEHNDGRRIVYGWNDKDTPIKNAGFMVGAGDTEGYETVASINSVARIIDMKGLGEKCIMQLPPERID